LWGRIEGNRVLAGGGESYALGPFSSRESFPLEEIRLLAPCLPSKIVGVGLNYVEHASELVMPLPAEPVLFLKPPSALLGPEMKIVYPPGVGRLDPEAELAVVIGQAAWNISADEARKVILGYTCLNDVTARDLQSRDGQWTRAKSFDTFCPVGPWIVTDLDPSDLEISLRVNGRLRQLARTSRMIFKVEELVSFISRVMTLRPGDVVATGTPPGVAPVQKGDRIEVEIEKIGILANLVAGDENGERSS